MLQPGMMREQITVQYLPSKTPDGKGGWTGTWTAYASSIWARHKYGRGVEVVRGDQVESVQDHTFEVWYDSGITAQMRVVWGSLTMDVHAVAHSEDHVSTMITCLEEQA